MQAPEVFSQADESFDNSLATPTNEYKDSFAGTP